MTRQHGHALFLGVAILCSACAEGAPPARDSVQFASATGRLEAEGMRWIVSTDAMGPLQIGMTSAEIGRAIGDTSVAKADARGECTYLRPLRLPKGTSLMMSDGRLVRIDVDSAGVLMDTGLQVGDSEVSVLVMHSQNVRVGPHKYLPAPAHVLTVTPANDKLNAALFVTNGSVVTSYRVGRRSAVELVERCG